MKFLNKRHFLFFVIMPIMLAIGLRPELFGKYLTVKSEKRFDKYLGKYELLVAMFYVTDKNMKKDRPDLYEDNKDLERMVESISKRRKYEQADLHILKVNTAKNNLRVLALDFNIKEFPTFVLFKNGVPMRDDEGKVVSLSGFVSPDQLDSFIEKYFNERIEKIIEEKEEARKARLEELRYLRYSYGPYWGYYGYPYYYWRYPYYGSYPYGFGFSFGGRYGW